MKVLFVFVHVCVCVCVFVSAFFFKLVTPHEEQTLKTAGCAPFKSTQV